MTRQRSDQCDSTKKEQESKSDSESANRTDTALSKVAGEQPKGKRNKALGTRGEDAAAQYLQRRGYDIIARNWTCQYGEVDIIARDMDAIIFLEVKTRTSIDKGYPEEAVTEEKRRKYELMSLEFLQDYNEADLQIRFDVIGIVVLGDRAFIRHHINAFGAA